MMYANQRRIIIESLGGAKDINCRYGIISTEQERTAIRVLDDGRNSTPFILFTVLALNQNGFQFDFSPAHFEKVYGISADRWRKAFKTLVDKGYLEDKGQSVYVFHALPERYKGLCPNGGTINESSGAACADTPAERDIPAERDRVSLLTDDTYPCREPIPIPADRESNNTIINNNTSIIGGEDKQNRINSYKYDEETGFMISEDSQLIACTDTAIDEGLPY